MKKIILIFATFLLVFSVPSYAGNNKDKVTFSESLSQFYILLKEGKIEYDVNVWYPIRNKYWKANVSEVKTRLTQLKTKYDNGYTLSVYEKMEALHAKSFLAFADFLKDTDFIDDVVK